MSIMDEIKNDITQNKVIVYMKGSADAPQCGFSARVCEILEHLGVDFKTRNVLENVALRQGIKEYSNWPTLPQLYVNGEFVGGCDIVSELYENGELQKMLQTAGVSTSAQA